MFKYMPETQVLDLKENSFLAQLVFPKDYYFFKGHFPNFSILPGMIQVHLAIKYAQQNLNLEGHFSGFKTIKFSRPLLPEKPVRIELKFLREKKILNFHYFQDEQNFYSKGTILVK